MLTNEFNLEIEEVLLSQLTAYPKRARVHGPEKLRMLVGSIQEMGFTHPILIDETGTILSGHLRVEAMVKLGFETIPAVRVEHLSPDQKTALVLSSNKLPELGTWLDDPLREELLTLLEPTCQIDLEITGFEIPEIDLLVIGEDAGGDDEDPSTNCCAIVRSGMRSKSCSISLEP